ncbi:MAG: hypothetical protein IJE89_00395 [Bacilli bacterium]|nr:hypothetical protein [Bacilli bacterium]
MNNKKIVAVLLSLTIIFTIMGGTLAYFTWESTTNTGLAFTITRDFSCSADGGGDITPQDDITLIPVDVENGCANNDRVIEREITVKASIEKSGLTIGTDLWLTVNSIGEPLANTEHFRYAISTVQGSCLEGMEGYVNGGNFKGAKVNSKVPLLSNAVFTETNLTKEYYLYIWLDKEETNNQTQDQEFNLSLGGQCSNEPQANKPVLDPGMIPVKIANDGTVTTVSPDDSSWYNYGNKEWANVVLTKIDGFQSTNTRDYYQSNLANNVEVDPNDITAYYVWIPRYKYKISTNTACSNINNLTLETHPECYNKKYTLLISEEEFIEKTYWTLIDGYGFCNTWEDGTIDNFSCSESDIKLFEQLFATGKLAFYFNDENTTIYLEDYLDPEDYKVTVTKVDKILSHGGATSIDIGFETRETPMTLENATTEYRTHPAFWWDDDNDNIVDSNEMLDGIWVGKFETTEDFDMTGSPTILPDSTSLTNKISTLFTLHTRFKIEYHGLSNINTDSHMIKNSEWGAAAYLSHSKYGINKEVRINNNSDVTTGCGASTANAGSTSACQIRYGEATSYPQSTTGNISGIFDMSGGANEYVMGHYGNTLNNTSSGFTSLPDKKYYDAYPTNIFTGTDSTNLGLCTAETCGGHALNETAGWYSDNQGGAFVNFTKPFFIRGGRYDNGASAGVFAFNDQTGASTTFGSRSVIVTGYGS